MSRFKVPVVLWGIAGFEVSLAFKATMTDLPAQPSTDLTSPEGIIEGLVKSTALSAPLVFLAGVIVVGAMAFLRGSLGKAGDVLAIVIAGFLAVASLGGSFAAGLVTAPRLVLILSGKLGIFLALLIVFAVIYDFRMRRALPHT